MTGAAKYDVLIVGGGLVGLAQALLLSKAAADAGHSLSVAVVEQAAPAEPAGEIGLRVSAISPASARTLSWRIMMRGTMSEPTCVTRLSTGPVSCDLPSGRS